MGSTTIDMKTLSSRQLAIARAVAATLFQTGGEQPVPGERLDFAIEELRDFVARVGFQTRLAFGAALFVLQAAPFLMMGKLRRFTRISARARKRCLEKLEASRLGLVIVLLKSVLSFVYFEHPEALASTGFVARELLEELGAQAEEAPISKIRLRVIEARPPLVPGEQEPEVVPAPAATKGRAAGGS